MVNINAVIFDADGTLLDSREFIYQAYEHTLAFYGYPSRTRAFMDEHLASPLVACYEAFAPGCDIEAMRRVHRDFQENNLALIDSYEGLVLTLDSLRDRGIKVGICTSRGPNVHAALTHVGIHTHCDVIVHSDMVVNHKPHPEGVLLALEKLGVSSSESAMVGDMYVDIEAGKAAGLALVIGVTHGLGTAKQLKDAGADHIIERLPDLIPLLVNDSK